MSEDELNLSKASTKTLLRMQRKFYAKFAIKEFVYCLQTFNFDLIWYYLKQQMNPKVLVYTMDSVMRRLIGNLSFKNTAATNSSLDLSEKNNNGGDASVKHDMNSLDLTSVVSSSEKTADSVNGVAVLADEEDGSKIALESERETV